MGRKIGQCCSANLSEWKHATGVLYPPIMPPEIRGNLHRGKAK